MTTKGVFGFNLKQLNRLNYGPARVAIDLIRGPLLPDEFSPLAMPDQAEILLGGKLANCIEELLLSAETSLKDGTFCIPVGNTTINIEIQSNTQLQITTELRQAQGKEENTYLQLLKINASKPIRLSNLFQGVSEILPKLETQLGSLESIIQLIPEPIRLAIELAANSADNALELDLSGITINVERDHRGRLKLHPQFHGFLRILGRISFPIDLIKIPLRLVPFLSAELIHLQQSRLLESAFELLNQHRVELEEMLPDLLERMDGTISGLIRPPLFQLGYHNADGTRREIDISTKEIIDFHADFMAEKDTSGDEIELETKITINEQSAEISSQHRIAIDGQSFRSTIEVAEDSLFPTLDIELWQNNPLTQGESRLSLSFLDALNQSDKHFSLEGTLCLDFLNGQILPLCTNAKLKTHLSPKNSKLWLDLGNLTIDTPLDGLLELGLSEKKKALVWDIHFKGNVSHQIDASFDPLVELDIHEGKLRGEIKAQADLKLSPTFILEGFNHTHVRLDQSKFKAKLLDCDLSVDRRYFKLPKDTTIELYLAEGGLSPKGPIPFKLQINWDMHRKPFLLLFNDKSISLFTDELRKGQTTLHLERAGKLSFSGSDGLYGARYFNALINPAGQTQAWADIFRSDDAILHIVNTLEVFSPQLAEALSDIRQLVLGAHRILKREGISDPKDTVPRTEMARILSLLLVGSDRLSHELIPIIKHVTEGKGLPLSAAKHLLQRELEEFDIDYEINVLLNWLHIILRAGEPFTPARKRYEAPLVFDTRFTPELSQLPSAAEIYHRINDEAIDESFCKRVIELAPYLSHAQLRYLDQKSIEKNWPQPHRIRIKRIRQVKDRVDLVGHEYGGIEHISQPYAIGAFLGEAVGHLEGINDRFHQKRPNLSTLGPQDVAVLLQSGLATGRQDQRAELNNRLLIELMKKNGAQFTKEVWYELGHQSVRALSGILYAFLEQDQDQLKEEIDLVSFLSKMLELSVPVQRDFLAGGKRARESYYQALDELAEKIISSAGLYWAKKQHLQWKRLPSAAPVLITTNDETLIDKLKSAIEKADAIGAQTSYEETGEQAYQRAKNAYNDAFSIARELNQRQPRAFTLPIMREFWQRNEDALRVLITLRGYQNRDDHIREWIAFRSGQNQFKSEQSLLEACVRALYYEKKDIETLLADPLVRLLIDPNEGTYDLSVVSCMGVITEGKDGKELQSTFDRLYKKRGIKTYRAATGTGRSLEYNAEKIIDTIKTITGPWAIIGYSQGCTNALLAEHLLYTGTPDEHSYAQNLVARNLLFSAANGSAHGSSGMAKFRKAIIAGEQNLKHYQSLLSWEAVKIALRAFRASLDSSAFVNSIGGGDSLSFERAQALHRDCQFNPNAPTSHSRAATDQGAVPEVLEYMYYCLDDMSAGAKQDTQVLASDAIGASTRIENEFTRTLEQSDMGSKILATHHWAPLADTEIGFVKTDRDRALAIYEGPKDHLVIPWIEVNARFGRIAHS